MLNPQEKFRNNALYCGLECISQYYAFHGHQKIFIPRGSIFDKTARGRQHLGQTSLHLTQTDSKLIFFQTLFYPQIGIL